MPLSRQNAQSEKEVSSVVTGAGEVATQTRFSLFSGYVPQLTVDNVLVNTGLPVHSTELDSC